MKQQKKLLIINGSLLALTISTYFLYSLFDYMWIGYLFLFFAIAFIFLKVFIFNKKCNVIFARIIDFILIVFLSLVFAIVGIAFKLFSFEYSSSILFNLLFIIFIIVIIYNDFEGLNVWRN